MLNQIIKYNSKPYIIDKQYAQILQKKLDAFQKQTKTTKQIFLDMVTANGLKDNMYSEELISGVVTMDDLF